MNHIRLKFGIVLALALALLPHRALATASSATTSYAIQPYEIGGALPKYVKTITVAWTADSSTGSVSSISLPLKGYLLKAVTNPGAVAPTANYDIALGDPEDSALDALGGALADRHTSNTEQKYLVASGGVTPIFVNGTYSLSIANNSVDSATGRIIFTAVDSAR